MPPPTQTTPTRDAGAIPDPFEDAVGYLRAHKWRPLGNPSHQTCLWLDPTKPIKRTEMKEPIRAWSPQSRQVEQINVHDGSPGDRRVPGFRVVVQPAAEPMTLDLALRTQMERDSSAAASHIRKE